MLNDYENIAADYRQLVGNKYISFDLSNIEDINLKKEIKLLPAGASILDIACGEGSDLAEIVNYSNTYNKNFKLFGSDISKAMISQAKKKDILSKVKFKTLDYHDIYKTSKLTKWTNRFDLIFCSYAIYTHPINLFCSSSYTFNDYLGEIFMNIKQLLKPGGQVIINFRDFKNLKKKAARERFICFLKNRHDKYNDQTKVTKKNNDHKVEYHWTIARPIKKNNKEHYASVFFYNLDKVTSVSNFKYQEVSINDLNEICKKTGFTIVNEKAVYFENNDFFSITLKNNKNE